MEKHPSYGFIPPHVIEAAQQMPYGEADLYLRPFKAAAAKLKRAETRKRNAAARATVQTDIEG